MKKIVLALIIILIFTTVAAHTQGTSYAQRFNNGTGLYNLGKYYDAGIEFRRAQELAATERDWAQAIYWVILSELAYSDYGSALLDMAELERKAPTSIYNRDMTYHKARIYFNQGFFEEALSLFRNYIDSVTETGKDALDRKAAAFYWMGECLFVMGQFNEAERFYAWVIDTYPESPKKDISAYRIDLIRQKKIEAELLALLQWSHEEALRTSEEYQRRMRTYEYTINAYQRRLAELSHGNGSPHSNIEEFLFEPPADYIGETSDDILSREYADFSGVYSDDYQKYLLEKGYGGYTGHNGYDSEEYHKYLLERARQLGVELEQLIKEYEDGAVW